MLLVSTVEAWASESRILRTMSLSSLKGCTLGIDVNHYINSLLTAQSEPLVQAIGGFPLAVLDQIDHDTVALKALGITPLFVFDGLPLAISSVDKPFTGASQSASSALAAQNRAQAWDEYDKGNGERAVRQFDEVGTFDLRQQQGTPVLIKYFIEKELNFVIAPYTSSAQLVYLQTEGFIDTIYGSIDVLMYQAVEKVIVHVDFTKASLFTWVLKSQLLYGMGVSHEQFVEACILVGCQVNPMVFPIIQQQLMGGQAAPSTAIKIALSIIMNSPSTYAAIASFAEHSSPSYVERFQKAYAAIQFQPVVKESGKVEPVTAEEDTPGNIHEFIGQRLPDEIYFYLQRGLVSAELLNVLTSGLFVEVAPLDGGANLQYRRFVQHLHANLYPKCLSLLSQTLHRYYQHKPIKTVQWFEPTRELSFAKVSQPIYYQVSSWKVSDVVLSKHIKSFSLRDILTSFYADSPKEQEGVNAYVASTIFKKSETSTAPSTGATTPATTTLLSTPKEIIANSILRALHVLGFFTSDHQLTPWGKVVAKTLQSVDKAYLADTYFAEAVILALLLVKDDFLNAAKLDPATSGGPENGSNEVKGHVLLLSRVATFISLRHRPVGFAGPLSHTVLAFQSIIAKQISGTRGLVESSLISLLANGEADRLELNESQWKSIANDIPFSQVPNAAIGVAMKLYLDKINSTPTGPAASQGSTSDAVTTAKGELAAMFKQAVDVSGDLSTAFKLWQSVVTGVKEAHTQGLISASVAAPFQAADTWVKPYVI